MKPGRFIAQAMQASNRSLPHGWSRATLGEVLELVNGRAYKQEELLSEGVPVLRIQNLNGGSRWYYSDLALEPGKYAEAGDLLYAWSATFGPYRYAGPRAIFHYHIWRVVPRASLDLDFAYWLLKEITVEVRAAAHGVAMPHMTKAGMESWPVVIPPLNEQRRIGAKLKALHSRSRRAREALDGVPPLLDKLRQSILAAAFRGDLTKDWRAKNPSVEPASQLLKRIRAERRKQWEEAELAKLKAKGKAPSDDTWKAKYKEPEPVDATALPELPNGWCWGSLDEVTFVVGGITKGQQRRGTESLREVPYLRVANVQRGHLDLEEIKTIEATEAEVADLLLVPGDILLNEGGDRDKLGRGWVWEGQLPECIHQNHVFRARPVVPELQSKYVSHYANLLGQAFFVDQGKQTTNLASVSMSRVRRFPVAVPPAAEQNAIIEVLDARLGDSATIGQRTLALTAQLSTLERSLLANAFRGELVAQDPADEPADIMLARLRGRNRPADEAPEQKVPKRAKGERRRRA